MKFTFKIIQIANKMEGKLRKWRGFKTRRRVFTCDLSDVVWIQGSLPTLFLLLLLLLLFVFPDGSLLSIAFCMIFKESGFEGEKYRKKGANTIPVTRVLEHTVANYVGTEKHAYFNSNDANHILVIKL